LTQPRKKDPILRKARRAVLNPKSRKNQKSILRKNQNSDP
jgi:hypothetical protein